MRLHVFNIFVMFWMRVLLWCLLLFFRCTEQELQRVKKHLCGMQKDDLASVHPATIRCRLKEGCIVVALLVSNRMQVPVCGCNHDMPRSFRQD